MCWWSHDLLVVNALVKSRPSGCECSHDPSVVNVLVESRLTGCKRLGGVPTHFLTDGLMVTRVCPQAGPIAAEGSSDNVLG